MVNALSESLWFSFYSIVEGFTDFPICTHKNVRARGLFLNYNHCFSPLQKTGFAKQDLFTTPWRREWWGKPFIPAARQRQGSSVRLRAAWSTELSPGQPGLQRKQKQNKKQYQTIPWRTQTKKAERGSWDMGPTIVGGVYDAGVQFRRHSPTTTSFLLSWGDGKKASLSTSP